MSLPFDRRKPAFLLALCWIFWAVGSLQAWGADDFEFHHENVMGTSLELRVRADSPEAASRAEDRVLREIDRLSAIFSGYDSRSEFSQWQSKPAGFRAVSPELFEILDACDRWRERSEGAFDPRVQVLTELWSRSAKHDRVPTSQELRDATERMRQPAWKLNDTAWTAERLGSCPLSLNAIAKGLIVERACMAALDPQRGIHGMALNVGGDLRVIGDFVQRVGVAAPSSDSESSEPLTYLEIRNRAVATSGSSQRGLWIGGTWYSHIFDPRSGLPAGQVSSATVIAERSADADALATCFNVLAPSVSVRLAESLPGVDCLIVTREGETFRSKGWSHYEKSQADLPLAQAVLAQAPASKPDAKGADAAKAKAPETKPEPKAEANPTWGDEFELMVDFEINRPERAGSRYRRPYIAVWVENKEGFPVRNLILWVSQGGAGPFQWIPDLKRWHAGDKVRKKVDKKDMVMTFSRPTRPPGKYSAIWNGKDDKGRPLPPGEYTINIDAAREHGTYQSIRKQVTIGDKPFNESLEGGVEVKSAAIAYRRKAKSN